MDNFLRQTAAGPVGTARDSSVPDQPPRLSGWRTGRLLGVGGSARVWLVEDERTGCERALKVITASPVDTDSGEAKREQTAQLSREVAVLGALNHPHLLGLRGVVSTDHGPGILTDYAGGGSLLNLVTARGQLSVGECITVVAPVAQALAYLHSASVQHGDVSPGNVLFTAEGKPLLADLGIGRLLGEASGVAAGTAGFNDACHGSALSTGYGSDVYSLAAIGWYALTGSPPGPARDRVPLTMLVPEVPAELLQILEAGLHEDPKQRPSAGELAEAVLRSASPQPLDLVAAVHPSVLPELLTRRAAADQRQAPGRPFSRSIRGLGFKRLISLGAERQREEQGAGRRRARRRVVSPVRWRAVVPRTAAALLVLCGALLVAPGVLRTDTPGTSRVMEQNAAAGAPDAPADSPEHVELSAGMRERLADPDPVLALSALVAVRALVLTTGDPGLLSHVNAEDSEAMQADRDLLTGLRGRGHVFNGLSIRLRDAAITDSIAIPAGARAVTATAVMSGYTETDSSGAVVHRATDSVPQNLVFVLVKQGELWKITSVHNSDTV